MRVDRNPSLSPSAQGGSDFTSEVFQNACLRYGA